MAILGVFVFHYSISLYTPFALEASHAPAGDLTTRINALFNALSLYGMGGVGLFFVISGFCIHLAFLRSPRTFEAKDFYWRRFLRIYPAYFIALVVFSVLGLFRVLSPLNLKMFLTHLLLVHNLAGKSLMFGINGAFWSLAVEWQLYLLYPLVLLVRRKWDLKTCLYLTIPICLLDQALSLVSSRYATFISEQFCFSRTLDTWCTWILGACLAEAYLNGAPFFRARKAWIIGTLIPFLLISQVTFSYGFSFFIKAFFFAVLMERYLMRSEPLAFWERLLVPIGVISYSIYLTHLPLIIPLWAWLHKAIPLPITAWWEILVFIPLTFLISSPVFVLLYWVGEKWAPQWIRRWRSARQAESKRALPAIELSPAE